MKKNEAKIRVFGDVQGVFFRQETKKQAENLDLCGWVKNMPDGSVKIVAQGAKDKIDELIIWSRCGSSLAQVKKVKVKYNKPKEKYIDFSIRM